MNISVGDAFGSFNELEKAIEQYENTNFVKLYRRDSRTIAGLKKRCPKRVVSSDLKYANITYACIHGGKKFKSRGTGKQLNTR